MAPRGSRLYLFLYWNLSLINHIEDEFVRDPGPTNDFHLGSTFLALFYNPTLHPALVSTLIPALVSTLALTLPSSDELFKQFIKTYLKSN